jgi:enamine deaminase RidA (YjgF/YER057c/UK114 family)
MAAEIKIFNPDTLGKPLGQYSQIARVRGASELIFIAGQLASDKAGNMAGADDFDGQCAQVFANIEAALRQSGRLGKRGAIHDLSRALSGCTEVPCVPAA